MFAKKDFSQLDQLMREDYVQHNPLVPQGSKGFRKFFEAWFKAVPDFKYEVKKIVSEGDLVWAYGAYSGTQAGDWLGIPATGRTYAFDASISSACRTASSLSIGTSSTSMGYSSSSAPLATRGAKTHALNAAARKKRFHRSLGG